MIQFHYKGFKLQETMPLNELFSEEELDKIIDNGISLATERAKDEGIDFELKYNLNNGNNNIVNGYTKRLNTNTLNKKEQSIINKYKDM